MHSKSLRAYLSRACSKEDEVSGRARFLNTKEEAKCVLGVRRGRRCETKTHSAAPPLASPCRQARANVRACYEHKGGEAFAGRDSHPHPQA